MKLRAELEREKKYQNFLLIAFYSLNYLSITNLKKGKRYLAKFKIRIKLEMRMQSEYFFNEKNQFFLIKFKKWINRADFKQNGCFIVINLNKYFIIKSIKISKQNLYKMVS